MSVYCSAPSVGSKRGPESRAMAALLVRGAMYTAVMPHDTMRPNKAPHVVSSLPIVLFFLFNIGYAIVHDGRGRYGGLLRGLFVESVQLELPPHIRNRHNPTLPPHIKGEPLRVNRDCLKANQIHT